jgi:hypothetical protein
MALLFQPPPLAKIHFRFTQPSRRDAASRAGFRSSSGLAADAGSFPAGEGASAALGDGQRAGDEDTRGAAEAGGGRGQPHQADRGVGGALWLQGGALQSRWMVRRLIAPSTVSIHKDTLFLSSEAEDGLRADRKSAASERDGKASKEPHRDYNLERDRFF